MTGIDGSSPFIFIWYLTMQAVAEIRGIFFDFTNFYMVANGGEYTCALELLVFQPGVLPVCLSWTCLQGKPYWIRRKSLRISLWCTSSPSRTHAYHQASATHFREDYLVQRSGLFIQCFPWLCLTGSRYHAQLKVTALFDREMRIFLRICCFGCPLKWSVSFL